MIDIMQFCHLHHLQQHYDKLSSLLPGRSLYIVGGVIRDLMLGREAPLVDIDCTMAGHPDDIRSDLQSIAKKSDYSLFRTEKFGTMTIIDHDEKQQIHYEITPFRQESQYDDFRHPREIVRSDSLVMDAMRRDFTINSLYYTQLSITSNHYISTLPGIEYDADDRTLIISDTEYIASVTAGGILQSHMIIGLFEESSDTADQMIHIIINPHGGVEDLSAGKITTVGNPDDRFGEDALRILRGLRFANTLNHRSPPQQSDHHISLENKETSFDIHSETRKSMAKNGYLVQFLSKERIHDEIFKVFGKDNPFGYVALLDELNILQFVFPAVHQTKGVAQPIRYHPLDVYHHSIMTLYHLQSLNTDPLVRLGMLYHDVGKIHQYAAYRLNLTKEEIGRIHGSRLNHTVCGAQMATADMTKLGCSQHEISQISWYVAHHMYPGEILMCNPKNRIKKARGLLAEVGIAICDHLTDISIADRLGQYNPLQSSEIYQPEVLRTLIHQLYHNEGQFTMKQLVVTGDDIMEQLQLPPGPQIGIYLKHAYERVMDDIATRNTSSQIISHLRHL